MKKQVVLIPPEDLTKAKVTPELSDDEFLEKICTNADSEQIKAAIAALPEPYREVMYYHFVVELSIPETAKLTRKKVDTVKKQVSRGKQKLLAELDCRGGIGHVHDNR